ncbi:hypothetical protein PC120_g20857 [Phytophthora cactorum]|nr:hypothetical protein PC120_g20857 [Phytophthora cactorum]
MVRSPSLRSATRKEYRQAGNPHDPPVLVALLLPLHSLRTRSLGLVEVPYRSVTGNPVLTRAGCGTYPPPIAEVGARYLPLETPEESSSSAAGMEGVIPIETPPYDGIADIDRLKAFAVAGVIGSSRESAASDESAESDGFIDGSESDTSSEITPADLIDTMNLIRQLGEDGDGEYAAAAAVSTPPLSKQEPTEHQRGSPDHKNLLTKAVVHTKAVKSSKQATRTHGQIYVLRFPQAKPRHNQRKRKKQARLETSSKPQKLAAIARPDKRRTVSELPSHHGRRLLGARSARCQRSYVCPNDYDYNFMIPKHLVIKLSAVVGAEKMKRKGSDYFDNNSESDHPEEACLGFMFRLSSGEGTVKVGHLVGMLARERMLSDIIIDFGIRCIWNSSVNILLLIHSLLRWGTRNLQ